MTSFDRPTQFTLEVVGVMKALIRTDGSDPSVLIYLKDRTASYLNLQVLGGTRHAGDPFTTKRRPIVPGPKAPRDNFGNLPWGYTAKAMQEPDVSSVTLKPDEPPALVRKRPGQPLEVLALIVNEVSFRPKRSTSTAWQPGAPSTPSAHVRAGLRHHVMESRRHEASSALSRS
ncbi:hypothetical protein MKK64_05305 [Methylobacterium sp. E-025]|uniref:hypothetical protein n=1 Tax=unclassified Methylobacterium TaxID=2615210 RepID=UPI001FB8B523|nr:MULTISPECIES: hypothetical protein [unclassified Methylobacterium]MCJ2039869.1 hypothetical protein [Methylobacterium sp. J-059]MCJ2110622.1 hypothetical protein [Methylobacterium sp. E-025]